jgi:hypothetical protein
MLTNSKPQDLPEVPNSHKTRPGGTHLTTEDTADKKYDKELILVSIASLLAIFEMTKYVVLMIDASISFPKILVLGSVLFHTQNAW